ncbi:MAG: GWxTD domain-containing protein [Gemmatimonadota bacterium]|nr:MAG: GWxTD domain-containing protein [Gemmatimonadota bacterium]
MKRISLMLLSAVLLVPPGPARAQEGVARRHVERGLALASAGDTALAFVELDRALDADPNLADAHYQIGRLYTHRASSVETDFRDRLKAEDALLKALELSPNDPLYLLELARLRLKQHMMVDAGRLFRRALSEAEALGDPQVLAEIRFNLGYIKELEYQGLRDRHLTPFFRGPPPSRADEVLDPNIARDLSGYLDNAPEVKGSGLMAKDAMFEHYRAALKYDAGHVGATTRLLGALLDEYRLSEYLALARRLSAAYPERPRPYLYLGLGLHAAGREVDAAAAFDQALARLPEAERAAIENLAPVMRSDAAEQYLSLGEEERADFASKYWRLTDPLLLTEANERRLEHLSRVAYADLRYSAPAVGLRGWETDQGIIYIRYGPPAEIAAFGTETTFQSNPYGAGRRSIIWSYGREGPVFVFRQMPGYLHARFAGDYEFIAESYRHVQPAAYTNIPSIPELLPLPVQIARFRGNTPDEIAVEIHADLPLESLSRELDLEKGEFETGLFLLNRDGEAVVRRVETDTLRYGEAGEQDERKSWRILMPSGGPIVCAVEARDAVSWRAAAGRDTFTAALFPSDSLSISDILVADAVRPLVEDPRKRSDYNVMANAALEFRSGESIDIYYELYGLQPDAEGFAQYDVSLQLRVKKLRRAEGLGAVLGLLADAWGFSMVGDDRLELQFSRQVRLDGRDRITEYLSLDPQEVPEGEYEIRLRIWDRQGQSLAARARSFDVTEPE